MPRLFRIGLLLAIALVAFASMPLAQEARPGAADTLKTQIAQAFGVAPRNFERLLSPRQAGVRILNVDIRDASPTSETITIDLSQRALTYEPSGFIEPLLDAVIEASASTVGARSSATFRFTIDGLPLDQFLSRPAPRVSTRALPIASGGSVVVSAGHGWYWDETLSTWHLQRPRINGIVEDLVNWDIAKYLRDELLAANISAPVTRYSERDEAMGPSGNARWQEGAKYFIQTLGAPGEVWDIGVDDYARDINARPFYANWIDASALISIHNNGGQETGTETWYDETNGQQDESRRLAAIVQRHVVSAIRGQYNPNWVDRGLRSCNGCKGETRLASRPAVIVEIAYMDTASPDNDALHDEAFKRIVAQAIREAIQEWSYR